MLSFEDINDKHNTEMTNSLVNVCVKSGSLVRVGAEYHSSNHVIWDVSVGFGSGVSFVCMLGILCVGVSR